MDSLTNACRERKADRGETYPKRPKFFAHKFCRLLFKQCAANEIGAEACWLLAVVAHTEDARHYTGAVTFFNLQLAPLVGLGSADALDRVRRKAVEAGWLHYEPGGKGVAGRYWVLVPQRCAELDDGPTDENPEERGAVSLADTAAKSRKQPRSKCGTNREGSAEHSSLSPAPNPIAVESTAEQPPEKEQKPKPNRPRNPLFDALAEVTGADPVVNGSHIGKVAALLKRAGYTPDDVREFAKRWRELLPWAKLSEHPRLTLGIIEKHIATLRGAKRPAAEPPRYKTAADVPTLFGDNAPPMEFEPEPAPVAPPPPRRRVPSPEEREAQAKRNSEFMRANLGCDAAPADVEPLPALAP